MIAVCVVEPAWGRKLAGASSTQWYRGRYGYPGYGGYGGFSSSNAHANAGASSFGGGGPFGGYSGANAGASACASSVGGGFGRKLLKVLGATKVNCGVAGGGAVVVATGRAMVGPAMLMLVQVL